MDDSANGYDGDSSLDDQWSSEGAGKPDVGPSGPAGEDTKGVKDARRAAAVGLAKKGEDAASGSLGDKKGGLDAAKTAEGAGGSAGFANNVAGKDGKGKGSLEKKADKAVPGAAMLKKQLKKFGPFGAILGMIITIVCLFSASQSMAPFGLVANGLDQFNSIKTIMAQSTKHYGASTVFHFSTKTDNTNRQMTGHIAGWFDQLSTNLHNIRIKFRRNKYKNLNETDTDADVISAAKNSDGLEEGLGSVKEDPDADEDENKRIRPATEEEFETESDGKKTSSWRKEKGELGGNTDDGIRNLDIDQKDAVSDAGSTSQVESNFRARANAVLASVNEKVGVACGAVKVIHAINSVITAMHVASVLNYVVSFLNAVQQAQAGDGGVALHYFFNQLSQKGDTYDIDGTEPVRVGTSALESDAWNQFFSDGAVIVSADDPVALKFNKDYSAQNSIIESIMNITQDGVNSTHQDEPRAPSLFRPERSLMATEYLEQWSLSANITDAYRACVNSQVVIDGAVAMVDIATSLLAVFTAGVSEFAKQAAEAAAEKILDVTRGILVNCVISAMASILVPKVARWLAMDLIENMLGEDAAYAINSGFNMYLGKQMQQSSGLVGDTEQVLAQYQETQIAIAEEGEYQRSIRSPFDITSKYTFLGSIVNSVTPLATAMSGPLSAISKTVNLVGSSINKLLPTASAASLEEFETSLNFNCPGLEDYGLVGDAFCNPYYVSEYKTLTSDDPYESMESLDDSNFDHAKDKDTSISNRKNYGIDSKSDLAKWTIACTQSDATPGLIDPQTMTKLTRLTTGSDTLDNVLDGALSLVPIVGSVSEYAASEEIQDLVPWADGVTNCRSEQGPEFSRYSEDQRWLEASGDIEESAVAAFLREYYEENPLDNSTEGIIARYAGTTKKDVEDILAVIEYGNWLADYNPDETYGPTQFETTPHEDYQYESDSIIADAPDDVIADVKFIFVSARNEVEIG